MSKLEKALSCGGIVVFTMRYKPDFPIDFIHGSNPFCDADSVLFGDIIHPDDYQPFCEIVGDIVNKRSGSLRAH